jgi:membrane-associated phospholipid phosphatase
MELPPFKGFGIAHLAFATLGEFGGYALPAATEKSLNALGDQFPYDAAAELEMLHDLIAYRDGVMGEALAQIDGLVAYFQALVGFNAVSHPQTCNLCGLAMALGEMVVMQVKRMYMRPRPSQLMPSLMPPIPVPAHPAFPSGHATEAHLVALVLESVLPKTHQATPALLRTLATRIAINREVLGLHYRSDGEAGVILAEALFTRMQVHDKEVPKSALAKAWEEARDEWAARP